MQELRDPHGQPINRRYNAARLSDRAVDELIGLSRGVMADGSATQAEAEFLARWLGRNRAARDEWPGKFLYARLTDMLADGHLDPEERRELLSLLSDITGEGESLQYQVESLSTQLPLTRPPPAVIHKDREFCLTGKFVYGTRRECEQEIASRGGATKRNPTRETDYLVIGYLGSTDWIHSTHGRKLMAAARGTRLYPLFAVAVGTGARQGEIFALQWRDIDLDSGILTIQRTLTEVAGKLSLGEPKTPRSRRRVDLPSYAVEALREHRRASDAIPHPTSLLFTDTEGKPLRKSNFTRRVWHPLLQRAGLPRVRFHSLRHSHVTMLLADGGNLKAVSERVGHSRTSMTADVYSHAVEGMQRELADKLDRLFG